MFFFMGLKQMEENGGDPFGCREKASLKGDPREKTSFEG